MTEIIQISKFFFVSWLILWIEYLKGERVFRDPSHFVSSVRWRRHDPDILLTANSQGRIKLMELIS